MVLATTKMPSPGYLTSSKISIPKHSRSRFPAVCLRETTFSFSRSLFYQLCFFHMAQPSLVNNFKRMAWSVRSNADSSGLNSSSSSDSTSSGTRLIRAIQTIKIKLNARIKELKRNLPMKLLFFLVGFYCATAFATVIGQTGDWDILSAALAVVVVEGIGALMYKALPIFDKARNLITMFNYWKAGLSLGLYLDSFKY